MKKPKPEKLFRPKKERKCFTCTSGAREIHKTPLCQIKIVINSVVQVRVHENNYNYFILFRTKESCIGHKFLRARAGLGLWAFPNKTQASSGFLQGLLFSQAIGSKATPLNIGIHYMSLET